MIINLKGSNNRVLIELLSMRGIKFDENAPISIIERGSAIPEKGISLVFDPSNLDELIEFIDALQNLSNNTGRESGVANDVITGKHDENYEILKVETIAFFKSDGNYVFCLKDDEKFLINKKLYELESYLSEKGFVRISKSYLVNILWIKEICPWFGGRLLLKIRESNDEIEVSKKYVKSFKNFLGL
jgi:DNA-binding LytR/AlgR family response regulator